MAENLLRALDEFAPWEKIPTIAISEHNFDIAFDSWQQIAPVGHSTQTYAQAFFEDLKNNIKHNQDSVIIQTSDGELSLSLKDHNDFWSQYQRPEDVSVIASKKDRIVDLWSRRTDGEFFTPAFYAKLGHEYLSRHLQGSLYEHAWWDMCCGTGNLTKDCPLEMHERLYMSTLNDEDVNILVNSRFHNAHTFTQDFLNTDEEYDFINTSRDWVFVLNPPYSASPTIRDEHKKGVSDTLIGERMKIDAMNKAASNLTTQFLWKILQISKKYDVNITIGMFTQISFVTNQSYAKFYSEWLKRFNFVNGFCFHCSEFEGTTGEWPVVFSVWSTQQQKQDVTVDIYEERKVVGTKMFAPAIKPLSKWIDRPKNQVECAPLTSAITVATADKTINLTKLPLNALGFAVFAANDVMHSKQAYLLSGPYANGSGWGILESNFEDSMAALGLRAIIKGTWLNDRDQFNVPDIHRSDYEQFKNDLIMWVLFSNFNHSASIKVVYEDNEFEINNHFFWKNDCFVERWLKGRAFSSEAQEVFRYCNLLYETLQQYKDFADDKFQLERSDAGWYQWRKALCGQNSPNKMISDMYVQYKKKHKALTECLVPLVYDFGVLPKELYFNKMKNSKQVRLHTRN